MAGTWSRPIRDTGVALCPNGAIRAAPSGRNSSFENLANILLSASGMLRIAAFLSILAACGTGGALEQAELSGECEGQAGCATDLSDGPLAAGGTADVTLRLDTAGSSTPATELLAADEAVIKVTGNQVTGLTPGMSAVLALDGDGRVLDFFHLFVAEPDRLEMVRLGGVGAGPDLEGEVELLVGDELTLGVVPFAGPQRLVGTGAMVWDAEGDAATLLADGNPERRRLVARAEGTSEISVEMMGLRCTLDVVVYP